MDMYATALVASAHGGTVAILDSDLIYLHPPLVDEIRDAIATFLGTQRSHVLINCAHSHSAPTSSPVKIEGEQDRVRPEEEAYIRSLPHLLLSAVKQANAAMRPARIGGGSGHLALSVNRREKLPDGRVVLGVNHAGPVDHRVGVVRVDSRDGRPLAALVNYACHPIFVGSASRLISPDFPGPLRRTVERETGALCLFLQGATGNVNPRSPMHPDIGEAEPKADRLSVNVPVQVLWINDVAAVGVAGELFVEVQLAIKKASPFASTLVAAYSNGRVGYLPVAEAYPDGGYEVDHSYKGYRLPAAIAPGAAEHVAETAIGLLRALSEERAPV